MPKAIWKGAISFGLVNIPIKIYPATKPKVLKFRLIHKVCGTPLQYKKWCPHCNKEVPNEEIIKAYPLTKEKFIPINKEDFERVKLPSLKTIEILEFIDLGQVDPIYFQKAYYVAPEETARKAYSLLVEVLRLTNRAAVGKVVMRGKEYLVLIRAYKKGLVMHTLYYLGEVRDIEELPEIQTLVTIREEELKMAQALVEKLSHDFDLSKYKDEYTEQLVKIIEEKSGLALVQKPEESKKLKSLMEVIKKRVEEKEENKETDEKKTEA